MSGIQADSEATAINALMDACGAWLHAQEVAQPERMADIRKALAGAGALAVQVEIQSRTKFVSCRLVAIDGEGGEVAVIRSLNAQPAPRPVVQ